MLPPLKKAAALRYRIKVVNWQPVDILTKTKTKNMRKFLLLLGVVLLCIQLSAQQRTITGKITDEKGNPVPNASIVIKNTSSGTVSKEDGTFSLFVPPSPVFRTFFG
jgi:hypothetical protein